LKTILFSKIFCPGPGRNGIFEVDQSIKLTGIKIMWLYIPIFTSLQWFNYIITK
jgi:hypothetical protein